MGEQNEQDKFDTEIQAWCYGLEKYPGEVYPALVHAVIKEMSPHFLLAVKKGIVFDPAKIAERICQSARYLVHDKEVVFSILARLPKPDSLHSQAEVATLTEIVKEAEKTYEGTIERMKKRWENL